jgi:predicted neuraminidase
MGCQMIASPWVVWRKKKTCPVSDFQDPPGSILLWYRTGCQEAFLPNEFFKRGYNREVTFPTRGLKPQSAGYIFTHAPFQSCHAPTLAETPSGLAAAWFGGSAEGHPDVGIWFSRWSPEAGWSTPMEAANGLQSNGQCFACWNPVLFQYATGLLHLFYKAGSSPQDWWGMVMVSDDGGEHWSAPDRLPGNVIGPVKNKPVLLGDGVLLCPSSTETGGRWKVHFDLTRDEGKTWAAVGPLNDPLQHAVIQPTILVHTPLRLQILCRSKQKVIVESWSEDGGMTWQPMQATFLPNPDSGIDAVVLQDGRSLLVYNPTTDRRSPLSLALSADGKVWQRVMDLEDGRGEFSYPAVIQSGNGLVHITYTWKRRRIKHVVLDPEIF